MEKRAQLFDVCIVCALYEEAEAVLNEFSTRCNVSFSKEFSGLDRYEYRYTSIPNNRGEPLTVLVTWLSDSGPAQTGLDLKPFLHEFRPRFVAMTGFCAGYKKKVKWGDLVVAPYAYFYEAGKVIRESEGLSRHLQEMKVAASTSQVLHYTRGFDRWKEPVKKMKCDRLKRQLKETEEPRCIVAPMASGMAVRQDDPFLWLREHYDRNTVGLDMEAATFYQALRAVSHIHGLVVKGVCDYADMSKKDTYHDYAARASAVYLLSFIQEYVTDDTMPRRDMPPSSSRAGPSEVWNVPYHRNPYFTGRDELLAQLDQYLAPPEQAASLESRRVALTQPQAITGLGGIGKTQVAVEYAYRSREQGRYTHTLWVNAANKESILASFVEIAALLPAFSTRNETDQRKLIEAVKRWLEQCKQPWLLIFDNVDHDEDLPAIREYLPQRGNGSVLLTTRASAVGSLATSIEVETMGFVEGTQFLLRRAHRVENAFDLEHASDEEINQVNRAGNIVQILDHFPLALDQAGAYIEETQCSLEEYLGLYLTHRRELLAKRGKLATDYPASVATTWSLSFQRVQQESHAAAEFLHLCAFLAPDRIPEELLKDGAVYWPPLLQQAATDRFIINQIIEELLKYSLVKRLVEDRFLSIHRLVQAVQRDSMDEETQRQWAERVIRAVNTAFPDPQNVANWPQCLRYLDQAQACHALIENYRLPFVAAANILNQTGLYLDAHGLYAVTEPLYQRACAIFEQTLGATHPNTVTSLNNLAHLYHTQGKYTEAEPLYQRALTIREQVLGTTHPDLATSLNNLAALYYDQGKFAESEPLYQRALTICEQMLGTAHPNTAASLHNLATLYHTQGKFAEAESLYQRALTIREQVLGPTHPNTARSLHNLARLYESKGKFANVEPLYQRALSIREQVLGPTHPDVAASLDDLARLYCDQDKFTEAESLYQRALSIREQVLGPTHPSTARSLNNLAELYESQGKFVEAESLYQQALAICEQVLGPTHPSTAASLNNLAALYYRHGYVEAESLYQQALAICEQVLGPTHPSTAASLNNLAELYRAQNRYSEAEPLWERALLICEQQLGQEHPTTLAVRKNYFLLLQAIEREVEAKRLEEGP
jgi:tetratricopeptide (TPR) repeat protein/nucleoside phosphorylase